MTTPMAADGLITPSGITTGVTGLETPDSIELRKGKRTEERFDTLSPTTFTMIFSFLQFYGCGYSSHATGRVSHPSRKEDGQGRQSDDGFHSCLWSLGMKFWISQAHNISLVFGNQETSNLKKTICRVKNVIQHSFFYTIYSNCWCCQISKLPIFSLWWRFFYQTENKSK